MATLMLTSNYNKLYRNPEYNFSNYFVPNIKLNYSNICNRPFIFTISENIKSNSLKYFKIKLFDGLSFKSIVMKNTEFPLDDSTVGKNILYKNALNIIMQDFCDNNGIIDLKHDNIFDKDIQYIVVHYFDIYTVYIIGTITIIKHNVKPFYIIYNDNTAVYYSQNILITHTNSLCYIAHSGKHVFNTFMASPRFTQNTEYIISDNKIIKKYIYNSLKMRKCIKSFSVNTLNKYISWSETNDILTERYFVNKKNDSSRLISQCMFSDSGLRHRGTYTQTSNNNITKTSIQIDDETVYEKHNSNINIDKITAKRNNNTDYIIGWKLAKNKNGVFRIVKLGIPDTSKIVMPIASDFFVLHRKERCNMAIVLDIQEAIETIKTVVPNEKLAYSCIYDKLMVYSVGSPVYPDSFDDSVDNSCTHGIHFHRDRNAIFKLWML